MLELENEPSNGIPEQIRLMEEKKGQPNELKKTATSTANGSLENETRDDDSNSYQVEPTTEESSGKEAPIGNLLNGLSDNFKRYSKLCLFSIGIVISIIIGIVIGILIIVVTAVMQQKSPTYALCPICPDDWLTWQRKCYYFSNTEKNWTSSQNFCTFHGGSLFVPGHTVEMDFVRRVMEPSEHWIGIWREDGKEGPWKSPNGSVYNNSFEIGADGPCAYLDKKTAGSSWCHGMRNWICTKSLPTV